MSTKTEAVMQSVADAIIVSIEEGVVSGAWIKPWKALALPSNAQTGKAYQGGNLLMFLIEAQRRQYQSNIWATYKQWEALGAQVRKGEKGTAGIKWIQKQVKDDDGEKIATGGMFPSVFFVFNADQVDGYEIPTTAVISEDDRIAAAEAFFAAIDANVSHYGDRAYYSPTTDEIVTPAFSAFVEPVAYYGTLAHEFTHWTGASDRLARDFNNRFGTEAYAFEELVAELGSAMICAHLGIEDTPRPDHAQYLRSWLKVVKSDPKALWTAASAASKAAQYLIDIATAAMTPQVYSATQSAALVGA